MVPSFSVPGPSTLGLSGSFCSPRQRNWAIEKEVLSLSISVDRIPTLQEETAGEAESPNEWEVRGRSAAEAQFGNQENCPAAAADKGESPKKEQAAPMARYFGACFDMNAVKAGESPGRYEAHPGQPESATESQIQDSALGNG